MTRRRFLLFSGGLTVTVVGIAAVPGCLCRQALVATYPRKRIAGLSDAGREVLHNAAVLGPRVSHAALRAAVGHDPSKGVAELQGCGIFVERALDGVPTYEFASYYLYEAASQDLPEELAQAAHRAVFKALQLSPSLLPEHEPANNSALEAPA